MKSLGENLDAMIPITRFNKGEASKIFQEVSTDGDKIVLKNNAPTCILMNPTRYKAIMETLEDFELYLEAEKRIKNSADIVSHEHVMKDLGITKEELDSLPDVEID